MLETRMPGLWPSPITPQMLAESLRLSEIAWDTDGRTLGWLEGRGDRGVLVTQDAAGQAPRDLSGTRSVRAQVAYGGGDCTLAHGHAWFVHHADQRIHRQPLAGGPARPITPAFGAAASPTVSPDGRWVVYVHSCDDVDCLAIVDAEGAHWPQRLATGRDFYMQPAWHPDGTRLCWVEWDHPNMPWDGTELAYAELEFPAGALPRLRGHSCVAGGADVAILQPGFSPDGAHLWYLGDESGWGQLQRRALADGTVTALTTEAAEHAAPAWVHGVRRYALLPSGRVVVVRNRGGYDDLLLVERDGALRPLPGVPAEYGRFLAPAASPAAERLAVVASGPRQPARVLVIDVPEAAGTDVTISVRRRATGETVPADDLARPESLAWPGHDGGTAHGLYYPPTNRRCTSDARPPLIVLVHGGPTSQATADWTPQAQFFATRGYGVLAVNYRGSTGYGRDYMLKLRGNWGVYDVQDARTGAAWLAEQGRVDATRLVIAGGSAGGFTVLQSLVEHPGFYRAGLCFFGVANQFLLAADTHKFEARYSDRLLGPLPEAAAVYRARSPLFHADRIKDPVAIFQGEVDKVVPRVQSDEIVASLKARGVPHEYHVYAGEGHGWRRADSIEAWYRSMEKFLTQYVLYA